MKTTIDIPLNIGLFEAITRLLLVIPVGPLAMLADLYLHTYIFVLVPMYLIASRLTYYSPIKHLFRLAMHHPVFEDKNDPILSSKVM